MIWDLYPTFIPLVDATHVRVLLVFDPERRTLVGAGLAQDGPAAATLVDHLIAQRGDPAFVRGLPNPLFGDLEDPVGEVLVSGGMRRTTQPASDDVLWVLTAGSSAVRTIQARSPANQAQLAATMDELANAAAVSTRRRRDG